MTKGVERQACENLSFSGKCKLLGGTLNYKWEGMSPDQQFQLRNKELVQSHKRMVQKDANRQRQWEIKNEFKEKLELQAREEAYERRMKNRHKDDAKDEKWMQSFDKDEIKNWDKGLDDKDKDTIRWAKSEEREVRLHNRGASRNSHRKHHHTSPHSSRNKHILHAFGTLIDYKNISSNDISLLSKQLECRMMVLCG